MGQIQAGEQGAVDKAGEGAHGQAADGQQEGIGNAEVLHQHADVRGASAVRHLLAGEDLRELFRAAGGIFGGDHSQGNTVRVG